VHRSHTARILCEVFIWSRSSPCAATDRSGIRSCAFQNLRFRAHDPAGSSVSACMGATLPRTSSIGVAEGEREMKRFFTDLFGRIHARAEIRRKRTLQQAAREMQRRDPHGGSIWRSGKGGSHPG
jgi:hypothetical protein